jgi:Tfp pilus assembly protein PilO
MKLEKLLNEKVLIITLAVLIAFSGIFYFALLRPLAAEKAEKEATLDRIETDTSSYEKVLKTLEPQTLSEAEKQELFQGIPGTPNMDQVIKALEVAEGETGISISNLSFVTGTEEEAEQAEATTTTTADGAVEEDQWSKVFPDSIYKLLEEKVSKVSEFTISFEDVEISLNGDEQNIDEFLDKLEQLPRIYHIQNITYVSNAEKGNMDATVSVRVFYCEAFQEVME